MSPRPVDKNVVKRYTDLRRSVCDLLDKFMMEDPGPWSQFLSVVQHARPQVPQPYLDADLYTIGI